MCDVCLDSHWCVQCADRSDRRCLDLCWHLEQASSDRTSSKTNVTRVFCVQCVGARHSTRSVTSESLYSSVIFVLHLQRVLLEPRRCSSLSHLSSAIATRRFALQRSSTALINFAVGSVTRPEPSPRVQFREKKRQESVHVSFVCEKSGNLLQWFSEEAGKKE